MDRGSPYQLRSITIDRQASLEAWKVLHRRARGVVFNIRDFQTYFSGVLGKEVL